MKLEDILKAHKTVLKGNLFTALKKAGYKKVYKPKGFVYAVGSLPVLLVAHMDTVHKKPVDTICYSKDGNILMSPEGIGGDDRTGVYMILQIIREKKCHVLFCEDEEIGGVGAKAFSFSKHRPDVNYILEFDRRGGNDAVFYDCDNRDFVDFICSYGFSEEYGSFSDISVIAPWLGIAAVNLSAGYYNEYTRFESIKLSEVNHNIKRAKEIITAETDRFEYIELKKYMSKNFISLFPQGSNKFLYDEIDMWDEDGYLGKYFDDYSEEGEL